MKPHFFLQTHSFLLYFFSVLHPYLPLLLNLFPAILATSILKLQSDPKMGKNCKHVSPYSESHKERSLSFMVSNSYVLEQ